ncbi:hypothetical protein CPT76_19755 [Paenibacillus sp. AR247]|nr:hypothetical protein CPT76_19755 [Paenibacillus sp. AR247]
MPCDQKYALTFPLYFESAMLGIRQIPGAEHFLKQIQLRILGWFDHNIKLVLIHHSSLLPVDMDTNHSEYGWPIPSS